MTVQYESVNLDNTNSYSLFFWGYASDQISLLSVIILVGLVAAGVIINGRRRKFRLGYTLISSSSESVEIVGAPKEEMNVNVQKC